METSPTSPARFSRIVLWLASGMTATCLFAAEPPPRPGRPGEEFGPRRLEDGFRRLDTNRDQAVDRREFNRLTEPGPRLQMDTDTADYVFGQLDTDSNGKLTLEEFRDLPRIQGMARPTAERRPARKTVEAASVPDQPLSAADVDFFEKKIRPVLSDKCYKCHSAEADKVKGGLLVDTRDGIRNSGDNGHAVVPGNTKSSLLLRALRYEDSDLQMPPPKEGGKLSDEIIGDFEKWIAMGAPDPRVGKAISTTAASLEKGREHWAYQLPRKTPPPQPKNAAWACNDLDRFILAELEAKHIDPVADADPGTLLRRVYFDLIGLPPSPEEVAAFVAEFSSAVGEEGKGGRGEKERSTYERLVDRLLASPQFGERWGRHWLDVAHYAESSGKENNIVYPHAWRYRDWVIASFNEDKPYDRFLREQIAGDLLPTASDTAKAGQMIATGFLALGPKSHNTRDFKQFQLDVADEQIDAVSQGMLGLTVACARCHDHKFDPIPQADYYAMAGIFLSTETRFGTPRFIQNNQAAPLLTLPEKAELVDAPPLSAARLEQMRVQVEREKKERDELQAAARAKGERAAAADPRFIRANVQIAILEKQLARYDENGKPLRLAMGVQDKSQARDAQLLQRGELDKPQQTVPRGFVQVLARREQTVISRGSGRLELADWIASPENPLTARVMANRVWLNLFGAGLVPTPNNFGTMGQKPTHPPLLDHLAIAFVENGWSVKKLIKQMVMSHTYRLSSDYNETNYAADPDNVWRWRMSRRRLDAEALRDAMLTVAGQLDLTPPKGSPVANFEGPVQQLLRGGPRPGPGGPGGPGGGRFRPGAAPNTGGNPLQQDRTWRSVYLPIVRDQVPDSLAVFDFAEPSLVIGEREDTTVPSQALYLMNSASVQRLAEAMASRLLKTGARGGDLGRKAFELAYGRPATTSELKATGEFFERFNQAETKNQPGRDRLGFAGVTAFCQALLGSAEFRYLY